MTLGQLLFELRSTQNENENGLPEGRIDKATIKCLPPPLKWGHKNENFKNLTSKAKVIMSKGQGLSG
jgi:hypothetical protein